MTLRRTLVLVQIGLVALGLVAFGVTSYQLYRQSQEQGIRATLGTVSPALEVVICRVAPNACPSEGNGPGSGGYGGGDSPGGVPFPAGGPGSAPSTTTVASAAAACETESNAPQFSNLPPGSFAELRSATGKLLASFRVPFLGGSVHCPEPDLPATVTAGGAPRTFQVRALDGPGPFLVQVERYSDPGQGGDGEGGPVGTAATGTDTIVTGVPLVGVTGSLHHLLALDLAIGFTVMVVLGVTTLVLVRRSLRPLERMVHTSQAISAGEFSRRIPAANDRTEIGQLGTALNHMLASIERAFAERDATESRLRQFLADASHELRTPLTSIRGYAELWRLRRSADDGAGGPGGDLDDERIMARIEEQTKRMGGMVEELLLLARLDATRPPTRERVDLVVVAAETCDEAAAIDPARRISLDAPDPAVVLGDAGHLRQALSNLTVNAIRHTPAGTPLDVTVRHDGAVAAVTVRDHGPGLDEQGLAHAFDRFWQADRSRATGGSGLGLAIVAGVAAEHGGAAAVANAPDGGAAFTIRIPLAGPPAATTGPSPGGRFPADPPEEGPPSEPTGPTPPPA